MNRYFSRQVVLDMREAITGADGNEVFFLGRTDEAKVVVEVEPLARGNRDAVAAIMVAASFGDVVIHNHPSGNLTPSHADLEIAATLGNQGVGFYIIDNGVEKLYQAVAPFRRVTRELLSYPEIERWYAPSGILAARLDGYEYREEQTRMAFAVAEAFNEGRVAVIEAGTGTGKSLAYLLPVVIWAIKNKERVVVSTNTINLQEQLTKKDIPFLTGVAGIEFRAVLVKGRGNYLCLRKMASIKTEPSLFVDDSSELQAIIAWSATTADGCRSDLSFIPRDEVWEEVSCEADQCGRVRCPSYGRCFFYTARRAAAGADLLVVNHALLMADLAVRQETGYGSTAILPPFTRVIFDEAHHLEDVATDYLSAHISRQGLLKLLGKLQHPRKAQRGLLVQLSSLLSREVPEDLDDLYTEVAGILEGALLPARQALTTTVTRVMDALGVVLLNQMRSAPNGERKLRLTPRVYGSPYWQQIEGEVRELARELSTFASQLENFVKGCGKLPEKVVEKLAGPLIDLRGIKGRIASTAENLLFFVSMDDGFCRWFEVQRGARATSVRLCFSPVEVSDTLKKTLFDRFNTVILTSATLAVGERFDYLEQRTGISLLPKSRVSELLLTSPFDYAVQAFVGVPADMPEPTATGYETALAGFLRECLIISEGRAFVLFTSYDLMGRIYNRLAKELSDSGLTPLRQGEMSRHLLLSRFKRERNAVLFATDSFWEGVDVQGRALELVVITRLPFRVPTEPVLEARAEHLAAAGHDPFMDYAVPQAVLKFKQGFGRLIRSKNDRGGVLILDSRVVSKNYGRSFLRALPETTLVKGSAHHVIDEMARFFTPSPASNALPRSCSSENS